MDRDRKKLIRGLQGSIGEPGTGTIVRYVDLTLKENNENMFNTRFETLATEKELGETRKELGAFKYEFIQFRGEVKEEFAKVRGEAREEFAKVRGEMKEGFAKLKGELEVNISEFKSDILRWMFAFFVTMLLALLGLYFKK
jgi:hypothetical protein